MDPYSRGAETLPLCKCRVLYIGSALPTEKSDGIAALQKPLRERYKVDKEINGIDARLLIYNNGVRLEYVQDSNVSIWFPIATLQICGAVKARSVYNAASGVQETEFVPLDGILPNDTSFASSPPIFSLISRRNYGVKALECHCFICKSDQSAMALVECGSLAYETSEEVTMMNDLSDGDFMTTGMKDDFQSATWSRDESLRTEPGGYYLANGERLVQNYGLWSNQQQPGPGFQNQGQGQGTMTRPPPSVMGMPQQPPMGNLPPGARVVYIPAKHFRQRQMGAPIIDRAYQDTIRGPPIAQRRKPNPHQHKPAVEKHNPAVENPVYMTKLQEEFPPPPDRIPTPPPDYDIEKQTLERSHDAVTGPSTVSNQEFLFSGRGHKNTPMYQPTSAAGPSAYDRLQDKKFNEFHEALGYVP